MTLPSVYPTASDYETFLAGKQFVAPTLGQPIDAGAIHPSLFGFQRAVTTWAIRKGRAALFLDTGLGKTRCQIEYARLIGERALILAPLGVARQTVREAAAIGVEVTYARHQRDASDGLTITNYEMLEHFDPAAFGTVVLDESSLLKSLDGKTRTKLIELFADTPYRLCCTATPAPNDITEIANHAEFLGVMRRVDMLAAFFIHDDEGWRLKGHAESAFYRWLASWAMAVRFPSDIGYPDDGYILPPLSIEPVWVDADYVPDGQLFFTALKGIGHRAAIRKGTLAERVQAAADLVNGTPDEPWLLWCGLNAESSALAAAIPGAVEIVGSESADSKAAKIEGFADGRIRVVVSKAGITGFGVNWQHCAHMVFVGLGDSWEQYYQCIRRCYRFGQGRPVHAYIVLSQIEDAIYANVMRKEQEARAMSQKLIEHVMEYERLEIAGTGNADDTYQEAEAAGKNWRLLLGDSVTRMAEIPDESVDLSVYSPPFQSLYTYHPSARDVGNCRTAEEFTTHFGYIVDELLRVTKPGRNTAVHVQQLATTLVSHGVIGLDDFRGRVIRLFIDRGWIYHGEICIDKDPQAQAIRSHAKGLLFVQLHRDAAWMRPALADYVCVFRKPGENAVPIDTDLTNDEWIEYARPIWYGIKESDTLSAALAREDKDERHICALQLGTIERCVRLWSNKGETVFSPFAGIGSELYEAVRLGRKGLGIELKPSYFRTACSNLRSLESQMHQPTLFDALEATP